MRKEFMISESLAAPLADAPDQDALNEVWASLGREIGFVWTTVADLRDLGDGLGIAFSAETEDAPPDVQFSDWLASYDGNPGKDHYGDNPQIGITSAKTMMSDAFAAGRRVAAENLAAMDAAQPGLSDDQAERMRQCFLQLAPISVPNCDAGLADGQKAFEIGEEIFLRWIEPVLIDIEVGEHQSFNHMMGQISAVKVMRDFAESVLTQFQESRPDIFAPANVGHA